MSDKDMTCLFCGRGGVSVTVIDEVTDPGCDIENVPSNGTRKVWVPRGDQYRTPEKWMEVEE